MEGIEPIKTEVSLDALFSTPAVSVEGGQSSQQQQAPVDPVANPAGNPAPASNIEEPPATVDVFADTVNAFTNPSISEEDKATRQSVLDLFKASNIDTQGNLLNAKGEVILKASSLKEYIENDTLPLNEKGDFVDDAGNVLKTASELASENSLVLEVKDALATNLGIEFDSNLDLPDTTEGLVQLVQEAVEKKQVGTVRNFLDSIPELKQFYQHLATGGTAENFTNAFVDYSKVNLKTITPDAKLALVRKSFEAQGNPMTESLLELIVKAGDEEITKAASNAIIYLDGKQKQDMADNDAYLKQQQEQQEQETIKYWNNVQQIVNKGTVGNLQIPANERQAFFDYMAKPVDKNMNSAEALASQNDTEEFSLMVSWLRYKGGDISKLVQNIAKTQKVQSLRERANAARGTINGSGVPRTNSSADGNSTVSLDSLLG